MRRCYICQLVAWWEVCESKKVIDTGTEETGIFCRHIWTLRCLICFWLTDFFFCFFNRFLRNCEAVAHAFILNCKNTSVILVFKNSSLQKPPTRGVPKKRCSENMQQIYRRTPMPKCYFNKVVLQLYWYHSSAWVFSCNFAALFQNTFS